jgi:hypothetical protein
MEVEIFSKITPVSIGNEQILRVDIFPNTDGEGFFIVQSLKFRAEVMSDR